MPRVSPVNLFTCFRSLHLQQQSRANLNTVITSNTTLNHWHDSNKSIPPFSNTANMEVPTKTSLADIYPEDALQSQTTRWNSLLSTFKDTYGKSADFVSRSPGRVNIIGEVSDGLTILDRIIRTDQSHSTLTTPCTRSCPWPSPQMSC